ncbi:MAG: cupin-like domain-containing protein, partial [Pyrinomonadaceae bacterium]
MDFATATARVTAAGPGHYYVMQRSIPDEFPELLEDFMPPHLVAGRELTTSLWFGSGENVTPLHFDQSSNFFAQAYGRKLWTIFDPSQTRYLYQYPASALTWHISEVDPEKPDRSRHPAFENAQPIQFTIEPGEMLYLPATWWHHARSCETSISVSFWFLPTAVDHYFAPNMLRSAVHIYEKMGLSGLEHLEAVVLNPAGLSLADAARISLPIDHQVAGLFAMASLDRALRLRMQSLGNRLREDNHDWRNCQVAPGARSFGAVGFSGVASSFRKCQN